MGCDLETIESRSPEFLADYFTDEEQGLVARTPAVRRDSLLTLLWSAKESVLKAIGCGLRSDTRSVNTAPSDFLEMHCREWGRVSAVHLGGRTFDGWWRESRDFVYTLVANPPPLRLVALQA